MVCSLDISPASLNIYGASLTPVRGYNVEKLFVFFKAHQKDNRIVAIVL